MTREEAIKHLKLMQSGARNAIRFTENNKEISEDERKEDIEIYQDQLEALKIATNALEQEPILDKIRTEIKEWYWQADKQALAKDPCVVDAMVDLFIRTIDKYKAESEE